jgi:peptidoglycan/xylan/chitin deacetylase (PgdA/CDA1 family)
MIQRVVASLFVVCAMLSGSVSAKVFVSLTFDDTLVEHAGIAKTLESYGMKGVFFMNSGRIGSERRYLTLPQVLAIQSGGHEIGGHTVSHSNLTALSEEDQYAEMCGDVANFEKNGVSVSNFAVPFGQYNNVTVALGKGCGYKSFRRSGGVGCPGCPASAQYRVCLNCAPGVTVPFPGTDSLFPLRSMSFRTYFLDLFLQTLEYARLRTAERNTFTVPNSVSVTQQLQTSN